MWNKALEYYIRLNILYKEKYGKNIDNFREVKNLEYNEENIDINRNVKNMTLDDCIFFSKMLKFSQTENMILFKYDSVSMWTFKLIEYKDAFHIYNRLLRSFRGVVLNTKKLEIVNCPFDKFANLNEYGWEENSLENVIKEFANAKIIEESDKLDGSLQSARWYENDAFLSGSGCIIPEYSDSLKDGKIWLNNNDNYIQMLKDNPNDTHIFEWISKDDAHIVNYSNEQKGLYLIGIRRVTDGVHYSYKEVVERANRYNVKTTTLYSKTLEELLEDCKNYKAHEKEGYVISLDGHLLKLKADDYVQIVLAMKEASSINVLIKAMKKETLDDVLAKVPEVYRDNISIKIDYLNLYVSTMKEKINYYYDIAPKEDIKTFMSWCKKNTPKFIFAELANKYKGKPDTILGQIYYNYKDELIESMKTLKEIEIIMKQFGLMTLSEYFKQKGIKETDE